MHAVVEKSRSVNTGSSLDFVWLELTNKCNLRCVHCYAESSPMAGQSDCLSESDYLDLIDQVYALGCRKLQFIGGEPTLNKSLPELIDSAVAKGFEFVEVFTNLTNLSEELMGKFAESKVAVATSFYSYDSQVHDRITGAPGSFAKTVRNMKRILAASIPLRAGIIRVEDDELHFRQTWQFLEEMGVKNIGSDKVRKIGRAGGDDLCGMGELCGSCAGDILSIGPDGAVAPCNMSKRWQVGSVLEESLFDIVTSDRLKNVRKQIGESVEKRNKSVEAICNPKTCGPYSSCCPTTQSCLPCAPNACNPCYPKG